MSQKQRLRTRTELDLTHLQEMQRVVDRLIVPYCIRRTRVLNLGIGVIALVVGALCALLGDNLVAGVVFGVVGVLFIIRGIMIYWVVARMAQRRMNKNSVTTEYIMEKPYIWAFNSQGDAHYPYSSCTRLLETKRNLYFITDEGRTIMLDKENLTGGTVEDLRDWLEERCQRKVEQIRPDWSVQEMPNEESKENPQ